MDPQVIIPIMKKLYLRDRPGGAGAESLIALPEQTLIRYGGETVERQATYVAQAEYVMNEIISMMYFRCEPDFCWDNKARWHRELISV